jgi:hypothetical protein
MTLKVILAARELGDQSSRGHVAREFNKTHEPFNIIET